MGMSEGIVPLNRVVKNARVNAVEKFGRATLDTPGRVIISLPRDSLASEDRSVGNGHFFGHFS